MSFDEGVVDGVGEINLVVLESLVPGEILVGWGCARGEAYERDEALEVIEFLEIEGVRVAVEDIDLLLGGDVLLRGDGVEVEVLGGEEGRFFEFLRREGLRLALEVGRRLARFSLQVRRVDPAGVVAPKIVAVEKFSGVEAIKVEDQEKRDYLSLKSGGRGDRELRVVLGLLVELLVGVRSSFIGEFDGAWEVELVKLDPLPVDRKPLE